MSFHAYLLRRLLLIIPTLLGVLAINFIIIQAAPGGPVDQAIAQMTGANTSATASIGGASGGATFDPAFGGLESSRGIDPELVEELNKQFGFDKPAHIRFLKMLRDFATFDLGNSFYQDVPVIDLVLERMPVSLTLGGATLLIVYLISIPLGIRAAATLSTGTGLDIRRWARNT